MLASLNLITSKSFFQQTVNNACKEEFHNRLFEMVRNSPDLDEILPGIGESFLVSPKVVVFRRSGLLQI